MGSDGREPRELVPVNDENASFFFENDPLPANDAAPTRTGACDDPPIDPQLAARALEALGSPVLICDPSQPDNPIIYANPAFEAATGYPLSEALGHNCRFLQGQDTNPVVVRQIRAALQESRPFHGVVLNYGRDGTPFWNDLRVAPIRDASGALTHWVGMQSDITGRVRAQEALHAATTRLETLIGNIQAGVIVEDDRAQLVLVNKTFCDMMGIGVPPGVLVGANVVPMVRGAALLFADPDGFVERALGLRRQQRPVEAEELRLKDGRVWERDYVPMFPDGDGDAHGGHLWMFRDVTERRRIEQQVRDAAVVLEFQKAELERANAALERANARLEALATTDGLTGLLNQRVFGERLSEEFRRSRRYGEPLSLILLDVDRFKSYNDSFGHLAGNAVLRELAGVLRDYARETDLVARFGGEEFALILPHTEAGEAAALAERLRSALEGRAWSGQYPITASLGVSELTPEMGDPDELVACADAAMYRAKAGGRNRVAVAAAGVPPAGRPSG